jgi:hypothetical protein
MQRKKFYNIVVEKRHDIQHNNTEHNDAQPNGLKCDTKLKWQSA